MSELAEATADLRYKAEAKGAIAYQPQRADPSKGFGPWEVHPQRLPVEGVESVMLQHNGDWLAVGPDGYLAFKPERGGRASAERFAALNNGPLPTRVLDLAETEHVSEHTAASVQGELDAQNDGSLRGA